MLLSYREEGIGTTERITFPDGVGLYIAMECYRGSNTEECGKLLDKAKTSTQKSCGKVNKLIQIKSHSV